MRYRVAFTFSDGTTYAPSYEGENVPTGMWEAPFMGPGDFASDTVLEFLKTPVGETLIHEHGNVARLDVSKLLWLNGDLRSEIQARREARGED
jgi:hypothetical protein